MTSAFKILFPNAGIQASCPQRIATAKFIVYGNGAKNTDIGPVELYDTTDNKLFATGKSITLPTGGTIKHSSWMFRFELEEIPSGIHRLEITDKASGHKHIRFLMFPSKLDSSIGYPVTNDSVDKDAPTAWGELGSYATDLDSQQSKSYFYSGGTHHSELSAHIIDSGMWYAEFGGVASQVYNVSINVAFNSGPDRTQSGIDLI